MSDVLLIPIIARGRIIMPGEDAVEFSGRAGSKFRSPDPHKHIHDLVLGNPALLADLNQLKMADIIEFLSEVGKRLHLKDNVHLQQAYAMAMIAGGLPASVLRGVYDDLPRLFDPKGMTALVDGTIGIEYLDGWVPARAPHANVRVRAVGTRQLHITAGNVPVVAALTILRAALTKSDCLIKSPSNDPLTANAIARTLIDVDAAHPVTKHIAVAYWKGGDEVMDSQIVRTTRIDKITAWGGASSVKHIQKFLKPGIDLTALNPKFSMSLVGREALQDDATMDEAAMGLAVISGFYNQTACANTRVVYVESDLEEESLAKVIELGRKVLLAYARLPSVISTAAASPNKELEAEMHAVGLEDDFYHVEGDTLAGGFVVSRFSDRVEFFGQLNNRVLNLVPVPDLLDAAKWCDDTTQTVGVYPESARERILDTFSLVGVQRIVPLVGNDPLKIFHDMHTLPPGMPHDGIEPMRRAVRWVIDHRPSDSRKQSGQPESSAALLEA